MIKLPKEIPSPDLDRMFDASIHAIHELLQYGCVNFMPKLMIHLFNPASIGDSSVESEEIHLVAIAQDFNEWEEKSAIMRGIGAKYRKDMKIPLAIALASEAWMSHQDKDAQVLIQPRYADNRKEIIMLSALDYHKNLRIKQMPIARDKDGKIIEAPFVEFDVPAESPIMNQFYLGYIDENEKGKSDLHSRR